MLKKILIFVIGIGSILPLLAGGGWTQLKHHGYVKTSAFYVSSDQHYTDVGLIDPNTTYKLFNLNIYGEYGLTDRLTLQGYFPFISRSLFNNTVSGTTGETIFPGDVINSVGDLDVSFKYGLIQNKPWVLSAMLTLGIPTGISDGGYNGTLQTGDGEFNQMLQFDLSGGFSLGNASSWVSFYTALNNRTNGFSDEFRYGAEWGGQWINRKLLTVVRLYGVESFQNGSSTEAANSTSLFANNAEHFTASVELGYQWNDHWGVSVNGAYALYGQLIFANPAYSGGVFYTW